MTNNKRQLLNYIHSFKIIKNNSKNKRSNLNKKMKYKTKIISLNHNNNNKIRKMNYQIMINWKIFKK